MDKAGIVNLALQVLGTRTTVTSAELIAQSSNEAIQANLLYDQTRDDLLRMAPWNCGRIMAALTYITSLPGTPQNSSPATSTWSRGQPQPPWVYEYQYPVDCIKPLWIVPQIQTTVSGIPIFPVSTGITPMMSGPPTRFSVGIDQFYPITAALPQDPGQGYVVGEIITLESTVAGDPPIGAPAQVRVTAVNPGGAIVSVALVNVIYDESPVSSGSYFEPQSGIVGQSATTGVGFGGTFLLTSGALGDQRVILTNEQVALLSYIRRVTNPNVMDPLFVKAWWNVLGAGMAMALTGDKTKANNAIAIANDAINQARTADANEGLTVNDFTPDWIRVRGTVEPGYGSFGAYVEWGGLWPSYV
jgi:hypothetical protein